MTIALVSVAGTILAALLSREGLFRWKRKNDVNFKLINIYAPLNYEIIRLKASNFSSSNCTRLIKKSDEILSNYSYCVPHELVNSYANMITDIDLKASPSFNVFCYVVQHQYQQCQDLINSNRPYFNKSKLIKNLAILSFWSSIAFSLLLFTWATILGKSDNFKSNPCLIITVIVIAFLSIFGSGYLERRGRAEKSLLLPSSKHSNRNP